MLFISNALKSVFYGCWGRKTWQKRKKCRCEQKIKEISNMSCKSNKNPVHIVHICFLPTSDHWQYIPGAALNNKTCTQMWSWYSFNIKYTEYYKSCHTGVFSAGKAMWKLEPQLHCVVKWWTSHILTNPEYCQEVTVTNTENLWQIKSTTKHKLQCESLLKNIQCSTKPDFWFFNVFFYISRFYHKM